MYVAILEMNPDQNEAHIVHSKIFIVEEHVVIVFDIAWWKSTAHEMVKRMAVVQISGSH